MSADNRWPDYEETISGQADASSPAKSAWVSANAGSGKTKVLIDRVARLLLEDVKPDAILCVTYTKAAASEMQGRLFRLLGDWCVANDKQLSEALARLQGRSPEDYAEEELGKARELFALALETPGGLRIETIHAFCGRLLRRFPLEAGAPPGFRELDDPDADRLWRIAMARLAADASRNAQLLGRLHAAALSAGASGLEGPMRLLLSKQSLLADYVRRQGGLGPAGEALRTDLGAPDSTVDQILRSAMTSGFPRERIASVIPALVGGKKTDISTGETLEQVLRTSDPALAFRLYRGVFCTATGEFRKSNPFTADVAKSCPDVPELFEIKSVPEGTETFRIRRAVEAVNARAIYERSHALLHISDLAFSDYAREKRRRAALDFDDLINASSNLLTRRAAAQWVLWKLDGGLSHVLLDEAQDTSPEQWTLLNALTRDFFSGLGADREGLDRSLFVVGDEKQSIYSFQGADPERFLAERREFVSRAAHARAAHATPDIRMSFRSAPQVLDFVDAVFDTDMFSGEAPFSVQPPAEDDVLRHLPFRREQSGCVELWPVQPPDGAEAATPWDAPRGQQTEASPKAQLAARIARWARDLIDRKEAVWDGGQTRPARPGDILILVRGRKGGLFDAIIKALKRYDLPVAGADRIDLLDSLPVQDLLNLIRFILCPEDDLTLAEILTGPFGGLNENDHLFDLAYDREGALWDKVRTSEDPAVRRVARFLDACLDRRGLPSYEFLSRALDCPSGDDGESGWDRVQRRFGAPGREPVSALLDRAAAFDASGPASHQLFLAAIEEQGGEVKRELSGPQDEVRVMTVHGAKGLEAPIVILPDTVSAPQTRSEHGLLVSTGEVDGVPPGLPVWAGSSKDDNPVAAKLRAMTEARALREHRRLLYVALTRAQDRLLVCGAWSGSATARQGWNDRSWYAACLAAMSKLADSGVAERYGVEGGEAFRYGALVTAAAPAPSLAGTPPARPAWLALPARKESPEVRYAAPTGLVGEEPAVLPPFGTDRTRRLRRGRLIHALLQTLPEAPASRRADMARAFLSRDRDLAPEERDEMCAAALSILDDPAFAEVFAPGGRAEAPVVGGNDRRLPKGLRINGRVDRLVVTDSHVLIVDYKTDRPAPPRAEDLGEAYAVQMAAYRAVLESAYPGREVRCAIVWTDGPKLMELPPDMLDRALESIR